MARPDGKSVYVTLPADRKTPSFAFAEGGVFFNAFRLKAGFGLDIFRFYSLCKETNIGFYSFFRQNNIRFYSFYEYSEMPFCQIKISLI